MLEIHDELIIRCPQLGGDVPFKYCRTLQNGLPCRRIIICWEFRFDIGNFLKENYSINEIREIFEAPQKSRIETIIESIEKAKKLKVEKE